MKNRNLVISIISFLFLVSASVLAYLQLIPRQIKAIPYYDSVLHFLAFGIVAFLAHVGSNRKTIKIGGKFFPIGILLIFIFACVDESLQAFSTIRTFDLYDLMYGVLGIIAAYCVDTFFLKSETV